MKIRRDVPESSQSLKKLDILKELEKIKKEMAEIKHAIPQVSEKFSSVQDGDHYETRSFNDEILISLKEVLALYQSINRIKEWHDYLQTEAKFRPVVIMKTGNVQEKVNKQATLLQEIREELHLKLRVLLLKFQERQVGDLIYNCDFDKDILKTLQKIRKTLNPTDEKELLVVEKLTTIISNESVRSRIERDLFSTISVASEAKVQSVKHGDFNNVQQTIKAKFNELQEKITSLERELEKYKSKPSEGSKAKTSDSTTFFGKK